MNEAMQEAVRLGNKLGLVPSFRNLYIWELAIKSEGIFSAIPLREAADRIIAIGRTALQCGESLDYFWFEDCCWRNPKLSFKERDDLRIRQIANVGTYSGAAQVWDPCNGCDLADGTHESWCAIAHPEEHSQAKAVREKLALRQPEASA